jgi:hypothetical protein
MSETTEAVGIQKKRNILVNELLDKDVNMCSKNVRKYLAPRSQDNKRPPTFEWNKMLQAIIQILGSIKDFVQKTVTKLGSLHSYEYIFSSVISTKAGSNEKKKSVFETKALLEN